MFSIRLAGSPSFCRRYASGGKQHKMSEISSGTGAADEHVAIFKTPLKRLGQGTRGGMSSCLPIT